MWKVTIKAIMWVKETQSAGTPWPANESVLSIDPLLFDDQYTTECHSHTKPTGEEESLYTSLTPVKLCVFRGFFPVSHRLPMMFILKDLRWGLG